MAELHSTRRKAKSSRLRSVERRRSAERPGLHHQRASLSQSSLNYRPTTPEQLITQIREVSRLLNDIYSTCVTAELALQGQNADHDRDIVAMLRMHVSEPIGRQVENLDSLVSELAPLAKGGVVRA